MKRTAIPSLLLGLLLIGAGCQRAPASVADQRLYCGGDGALVTTMPVQSHRSYCIKSDAGGKNYALGRPNSYTFTIIDDQGVTLKEFAETHTQLMHVFIVRKDLAHFEHVHPSYDPATGTFSIINLTFRADGIHRIFADFAPATGARGADGLPLRVVATEDLTAGTNYVAYPLGGEGRTKMFGDQRVTLETPSVLTSGTEHTFTYVIERLEKPVTDLEPYLGALGHAVVLREGTLDFTHVHPVDDLEAGKEGRVRFMTTFPEAGKYKIFAEFKRGGEVFATDFVVTVEEGFEPAPDEGTDMMH